MTKNSVINGVLVLVSICVALIVVEAALRVFNIPEPLISGWRTPAEFPPINQLGWRGQKTAYKQDDFVVVLVGDSNVECRICPAEETTDVILQRALRGVHPKARDVALGSAGFGTDQEYLALQEYFSRHRADLVLHWLTINNDIWNNTFRTHGVTGKRARPKPTFWLEGGQLRGPTEDIETRIDPAYTSRIVGLLDRVWHNPETAWATRLPPAGPGGTEPPQGTDATHRDSELLETQQAHWSVWMRPRTARVSYGIDLTRALLDRMRDLATRNKAHFALFHVDQLGPGAARDPVRAGNPRETRGTVAVGHRGHWYLADVAQLQATVADVARGFIFLSVPITLEHSRVSARDGHLNLNGNRQVLGDLARQVQQSKLLENGLLENRR